LYVSDDDGRQGSPFRLVGGRNPLPSVGAAHRAYHGIRPLLEYLHRRIHPPGVVYVGEGGRLDVQRDH